MGVITCAAQRREGGGCVRARGVAVAVCGVCVCVCVCVLGGVCVCEHDALDFRSVCVCAKGEVKLLLALSGFVRVEVWFGGWVKEKKRFSWRFVV